MLEKNIFAMSTEEYIIDMFRTRFETKEDNLLIDFTTPEQQAFADYHLQRLHEDNNVIEFNDDIVIIVNYNLETAKSLFGNTVCDSKFTRLTLAEMFASEFRELDYYDIVEAINLDVEFTTKEDIDKWFADQKETLIEIKESNYLDIVG